MFVGCLASPTGAEPWFWPKRKTRSAALSPLRTVLTLPFLKCYENSTQTLNPAEGATTVNESPPRPYLYSLSAIVAAIALIAASSHPKDVFSHAVPFFFGIFVAAMTLYGGRVRRVLIEERTRVQQVLTGIAALWIAVLLFVVSAAVRRESITFLDTTAMILAVVAVMLQGTAPVLGASGDDDSQALMVFSVFAGAAAGAIAFWALA